MDDRDLDVRNLTYAMFVELGRAPTAKEVARSASSTTPEIQTAWRRLHDDHAIVLDDDTEEIRMANPFSAIPTAYRVQAAGRWWYANCAWDAFGIPSALHADGLIEASCPDCGDPFAIEVRGGRPHDRSFVFHCLVPAARWWDDIVFT